MSEPTPADRVAIPDAKYAHRVTCSVCEASTTKDFFERHICARIKAATPAQPETRTEHHCPNCNVLISSGKHLCHACDLELAEWQRKRMQAAPVTPQGADWQHVAIQLKAALDKANQLSNESVAVVNERDALRAHADKLADALRETADVRIWGKSSPIFARALAALSDYEAIKGGAQ